MGKEARLKRRRAAETQVRKELQAQNRPQIVAEVTKLETNVCPPELVAQYNEIEPRLGTRLIENYLDEQQFRRTNNGRVLEAQIRDKGAHQRAFARGQWFGMTVAVLLIASGVYVASKSETDMGRGSGIAAAALGLAPLVWGPAAIKGKKKQKGD
ncbi:MAG: DUF2335 domain-containing protein [bacterium]|nr:DUF2335 domain-containing protein [bacterium]